MLHATRRKFPCVALATSRFDGASHWEVLPRHTKRPLVLALMQQAEHRMRHLEALPPTLIVVDAHRVQYSDAQAMRLLLKWAGPLRLTVWSHVQWGGAVRPWSAAVTAKYANKWGVAALHCAGSLLYPTVARAASLCSGANGDDDGAPMQGECMASWLLPCAAPPVLQPLVFAEPLKLYATAGPNHLAAAASRCAARDRSDRPHHY
jgi:hypothetical protein